MNAVLIERDSIIVLTVVLELRVACKTVATVLHLNCYRHSGNDFHDILYRHASIIVLAASNFCNVVTVTCGYSRESRRVCTLVAFERKSCQVKIRTS